MANAQTSFKTIIPPRPVAVGEAFQVQYILTGAEKTNSLRTPSFPGFRLISGPNTYYGSINSLTGPQLVQNFVFTLEAIKAGQFLMPGATVLYDNQPLRSNDIMIQVIPAEEVSGSNAPKEGNLFSTYYLKPGEDPYKKIRENLFVKVLVDRSSCFIGEPIIATFKLYSRLESRSDIIKNPGFYGFSVHDMVSLDDKVISTEKFNGNLFDVHTIRKVQLYPLQSGDYTIDAIEIKNTVEFSRSRINKKTEQEIAEGMMQQEDVIPATGTEQFETFIRSSPVSIHVKPLPVKNMPVDFSGAVGRFEVKTSLSKSKLDKNEQAILEVTITGKGNFIQLDAPKISWPGGVEGFEPTVKDVLDRSKSPLTGSRSFLYPFVGANSGTFMVPAITFSYYDIDSNRYKTIEGDELSVAVSNVEKKTAHEKEEKITAIKTDERIPWIAAAIALAVVLIVVLYWVFQKKDKQEEIIITPVEKPASTEDLLAAVSAEHEPLLFYASLRSATWNFLSGRFELSGSELNKQLLFQKMRARNIRVENIEKILQLLDQCEAGIFTSAILDDDREKLLAGTQNLFREIDKELF